MPVGATGRVGPFCLLRAGRVSIRGVTHSVDPETPDGGNAMGRGEPWGSFNFDQGWGRFAQRARIRIGAAQSLGAREL